MTPASRGTLPSIRTLNTIRRSVRTNGRTIRLVTTLWNHRRTPPSSGSTRSARTAASPGGGARLEATVTAVYSAVRGRSRPRARGSVSRGLCPTLELQLGRAVHVVVASPPDVEAGCEHHQCQLEDERRWEVKGGAQDPPDERCLE